MVVEVGLGTPTLQGLDIFSTVSESEKGLMISTHQINDLLPFSVFQMNLLTEFYASYCPKGFLTPKSNFFC